MIGYIHTSALFIVLTVSLLFAEFASSVPNKGTGALAIYLPNPRYFQDKNGNPIYLLGDYTWGTFSDPGYDYKKMFDTLAENKINLARIWVFWGNEVGFEDETRPRHYKEVNLVPYLRTGPGLANDGLPKFNLDKFNPKFFQRLKEMVAYAQKKNIYLQLCLFDAWMLKHKHLWRLHAYCADNNINGVDGDPKKTGTGIDGKNGFCSLPAAGRPEQSKVLEYQKAFIRKVVDTVNGFHNIYYEIANENYYNAEWELALCDYIKEYEKKKPLQHLTMPRDLPNHDFGGLKTWDVASLHSNMLKAHKLNQPLICDTDGIGNPEDEVIRKTAWTAFTSGGHFSYLDDSFQPDEEHQGDFTGSRRATMRRQLKYLVEFVRQTKFYRMGPADELIVSGNGYCLADRGKEYVIYLPEAPPAAGRGELKLDLRDISGDFTFRWYNPRTGEYIKGNRISGEDILSFKAPDANDWVLHIEACQ